MGFPPWTLWGMGISAAGALILLALSLLAQSPQAIKRIGLGTSDLGKRARAFTTYAFAFMILGLGFFLAGVPLGSAEQTSTPEPTMTAALAQQTPLESESEMMESTPPLTPETGAFGGPPPELSSPDSLTGTTTLTTTSSITGTIGPEPTQSPDEATNTAEPTTTPRPTNTPQPTLTPTPTATPLPTLTPTPISGQTAVVEIGSGTVWLVRSPGGQNLVLLRNGDTVILLERKANQGGLVWREIMTVNGISGWIQESFLQPEES